MKKSSEEVMASTQAASKYPRLKSGLYGKRKPPHPRLRGRFPPQLKVGVSSGEFYERQFKPEDYPFYEPGRVLNYAKYHEVTYLDEIEIT